MKKVLVIGCPGAGKTTFARQLASKTGLPLIHLDYYYHDRNYDYYNDKAAWRLRVLSLMKADEWIMDGNYSTTFPERFEKADTIIFFDYPLRLRMYGIFKRWRQYRNKKRDDMPDGWNETISWEFFKFVWNFEAYRPRITNVINKKTSKKIITFKNRGQTREYLKAV
jgi:adenylate kinase family enzyme